MSPPRVTLPASDVPAAYAGPIPAHARASARAREVTHRETLQQQANVQMLQASADVSLRAGDTSQALLLRSAIERINELLAPELGPDALQNAMSQDNTPEGTAGRILSFSTAFYSAYAARHRGEAPDQVAQDFVALIRGGFEKGYNEARDILQGLGVLRGEVETGIAKTYERVEKGLDDFLAGLLAPKDAADSPAAPA